MGEGCGPIGAGVGVETTAGEGGDADSTGGVGVAWPHASSARSVRVRLSKDVLDVRPVRAIQSP